MKLSDEPKPPKKEPKKVIKKFQESKVVHLTHNRFIEVDVLKNEDIRITLYWQNPVDGSINEIHELHSVDFLTDGRVTINKATEVSVRNNAIVKGE